MKSASFSAWLQRWLRSSRPLRSRGPRARLAVETLEGRDLPAAGIREQYMVELVNRMRAAPQAELTILLQRDDVKAALTYFNVNTTALTTGFAALTAQAPLAWSDQLAAAALGHTQAMLTADRQSHQLPNEASLGDRITAAGFTFAEAGENVFARAQDVANAHAAFAIDWGISSTGLQNPAGHRLNIMSDKYTQIGIGALDTTAGKKSGPVLVTQNFASPQTAGNPYVLGVVYNDANANGFYDMGEGLADVDISIDNGGAPITLKTTAAGYYQTQVPAGNYNIIASNGGLPAPVTNAVVVGAVNVKSDFKSATGQAPAQIAVTGPISVKEDAGTLQVKVTRTGNLASAVTVDFALTDGSAKVTTNYTLNTVSPITFAANETEKFIAIDIVNQPNVFTGDLAFDITLSNPSAGAALVNAKATATITDNDAAPRYTLTLVNAANNQIQENAGPLKVKVAYNGAAGGVKIATANGTALSPTDYTAVDQNLVFNAAVEQIIEVPIIDNTAVDGNRTFTVTLSNPAPGGLAAPSTYTITIVDDDVPPANSTVSISAPVEVNKTAAGMIVLVTRTTAGTAASVRITTSGGTALAGNDYNAIDQVLTFGPADTTKTINFVPTGNSVGDKTVNLVLSDYVDLTAGVPNQITITIKDTAAVPAGVAPTAVADFYVVRRGDASSTAPSVLANDTNATSAKLVKNAAAGTVTLNADGTFTYQPGPNFAGVDSFTYQASNAQGDSSETRVFISTHEASQVRKLYKQALNREPENGGWLYWTGLLQTGAASLGTVARGIFESTERLNPIIAGYYRTFLSREPEAKGLGEWRERWQREGSPENIISGILSSPESYAKAGGTNAGWVTEVYRRLLNREPEAEGLRYWTDQLGAGRSQADVVLGFITSDENRRNLARTWYQQYLGRAATQIEIDSVVSKMTDRTLPNGALVKGQTQRDIQIFIIDSQEYLNTPPPPAPGAANRAG